ncbi:C-X-C motif chemokine 3-like [Acanthopagrus latus]|uniref:C-X-C motif chemokine 3-like n=1 Tax=Acanthopagrus latus TaxID=8177 RepID=UPI00187C4859|nr:C-X-C motif chemokine 3-like [Acanthopagrus latus]
MNTAIQCIVLLACTIICTPAGSIRCLCVNTISAVDPKRIAGVEEYGLRPYCNKKEVIARLKDGTKRCLDPAEKFTIALVQVFKNWANRAAEMNATSPGTTRSPRTSTTTTMVPTSP